VIGILIETQVRVITFAPHATQMFRLLDLTLFGVLKHQPRYDLPFDDDTATVKFIMKVYRDFKRPWSSRTYGQHSRQLVLNMTW
jgi:hypothetical protein